MNAGLKNDSRAVQIWLLAICLLVTMMVTIGGVTRLTGSGLSITDWKPILGAIPPLTAEDWEIAFGKYREIPQFKLLNSSMTLSEFKGIYFWEWFHRLVGRLIGIVSFLPGLYFWIRRKISKRLALRVLLGITLGGLQGVLGWFMVKSGLSERTSVSPFRLAAHLSLALIILSYFVALSRSVIVGEGSARREEKSASEFIQPKYKFLVVLFALQIVYGAFVAGLKAGFAFNTFPLMSGTFIPSNLFALEPAWINFFENPATVQWIHRCLGWIVLFYANSLWIRLRLRKIPRGSIRRWTTGLAHLTVVQFGLGVATLVFVVPVPLGALHQLGAAGIVIFITLLGHSLYQNQNNASRQD